MAIRLRNRRLNPIHFELPELSTLRWIFTGKLRTLNLTGLGVSAVFHKLGRAAEID